MTAWSRSKRVEVQAPGSRAPHERRRVPRGTVLLAAGIALLAGCATFGSGIGRIAEGAGYYWQTITGHLSILRRAEPVEDLLARQDLDPRTRQRLELATRIRRFAVTELGLPDNGSYTRYADVKQPFVTWGVVAAPELSLRLTQWCFPIAGCVTYRGYYSLEAAEAYAAGLKDQGLDVQINGVPAYSTLGWLDDPLLSTFINYPDAEVARLVFHELAHQVVYVPGDSMFNESFATAVEQVGVEHWLDLHGTPEQRSNHRQQRLHREAFLSLLGKHRDQLAAVYAAKVPDEEKREGKRRVLEALQAEYREMRQSAWAGFTGYDRWFSRPLGNAHLGSVATYTTWVPVFRQLFEESAGDFGRFYLKVGELAALDKAERQAFLVRRSEKRIGIETLNPAEPADPSLGAPEEAGIAGPSPSVRGPSPAHGQVHAREQTTGATIPTYR